MACPSRQLQSRAMTARDEETSGTVRRGAQTRLGRTEGDRFDSGDRRLGRTGGGTGRREVGGDQRLPTRPDEVDHLSCGLSRTIHRLTCGFAAENGYGRSCGPAREPRRRSRAASSWRSPTSRTRRPWNERPAAVPRSCIWPDRQIVDTRSPRAPSAPTRAVERTRRQKRRASGGRGQKSPLSPRAPSTPTQAVERTRRPPVVRAVASSRLDGQ